MAQPLPSMQVQREFWDSHWKQWEERNVLNDWTERRAREILGLITALPVEQPRILDMGCGLGWFTERLTEFGEAFGIDLSKEGIAAARARRPDIAYTIGDIYEADLPRGFFDIVVSQEVISHVKDQPKYVERAAEVLKPGGYFIVTTGNRFVMERLGDVGWIKYSDEHIEDELTRGELKKLLKPQFRILKTYTIIPHGKRGLLRLVNSHKLNALITRFISLERLNRLKESAGFGWQMVFLAQKVC